MRTISTSNGCRSFKSVDCALRPKASETSLPASVSLPLGEVQDASASLLVFTVFIGSGVDESSPAGFDDHGLNRPLNASRFAQSKNNAKAPTTTASGNPAGWRKM